MGQFGNDFDVVEHSCATDRNKNYSDTCRELTERANRLGMNETGEAFLTGLSEDQCAYCKEFGHWNHVLLGAILLRCYGTLGIQKQS